MKFLEIRGLSKKYKNQKVLENVNLSFPSKGLVCLSGESGSGKSTFINCICGIEKMDKGKVFFQNKEIKNFDKFRNKYIGMIYQNINLISFLNVKDNIFLKGKKSNKLIEKLQIEKYEKTNQNVISMGESQRISILRALFSNSKILLCDEPTGSLDNENAEIVMNYLKELSKTILIIIVSHNDELMKKYGDYFLELENNRINSFSYLEENVPLLREKTNYLPLFTICKIAFKTLLKSKMKIILSLVSLCLSFSFMLFSYSASTNISNLIKHNKTNYLDYTTLKIVKEKISKINNTSLTLVKEETPFLDEIRPLEYLIDTNDYYYDMTPIFNSFPLINHPINSDYYLSNIEFIPYFQNYEQRFVNQIEGKFPSYEDEVIINKACSELLSNSRFKIKIDRAVDLKFDNNEIISDQIIIDRNFKVVGQVEEFDLLQTPKIYYPYNYLVKIAKEIKLDNLSKYYNTTITLYDRLSTIRSDEESFASNYYVYEVDEKKVENVYKKGNEIVGEKYRYKVYSSGLEKIKLFENVFTSVEILINVFVSITLIISVSLLFLVLFSYVLDFKKDIGIMLGIGVLKQDINFIFILQGIFVSLVSFMSSFIIYYLLIDIINSYLLNMVGINVLSQVITGEFYFLLVLFLLILSFLISLIISSKISKMNVSTILKED